jgi:hypothetical protein
MLQTRLDAAYQRLHLGSAMNSKVNRCTHR